MCQEIDMGTLQRILRHTSVTRELRKYVCHRLIKTKAMRRMMYEQKTRTRLYRRPRQSSAPGSSHSSSMVVENTGKDVVLDTMETIYQMMKASQVR